jgi:hypothetical protein
LRMSGASAEPGAVPTGMHLSIMVRGTRIPPTLPRLVRLPRAPQSALQLLIPTDGRSPAATTLTHLAIEVVPAAVSSISASLALT